MPTTFDHQRQCLQVAGLFLFVFEALLLRYGGLGHVDTALVLLYVVIQAGMYVAIASEGTFGIQWWHIAYTTMFFVVPVFARHPGVFALHLVMAMTTLALRAECGACPVDTMERDAAKVYDEGFVDAVNWNAVFWGSGVVTVARWAGACEGE